MSPEIWAHPITKARIDTHKHTQTHQLTIQLTLLSDHLCMCLYLRHLRALAVWTAAFVAVKFKQVLIMYFNKAKHPCFLSVCHQELAVTSLSVEIYFSAVWAGGGNTGWMNEFLLDFRLFHPSLVSSLKLPPLSYSLSPFASLSHWEFIHTCQNRESWIAVGQRKERITTIIKRRRGAGKNKKKREGEEEERIWRELTGGLL